MPETEGTAMTVPKVADTAVIRGASQTSKQLFRGQESGFTLLELLAVLALLTLLMGLVLPDLLKSYKREQERANIRRFLSILRTARSEAVTRHQRVRLRVDIKAGRYQVEGFASHGAFPGLRLENPHLVWEDIDRRTGFIIFYRDGSSSGGRLGFADSTGRQYRVEIETVTGRINLKVEGR